MNESLTLLHEKNRLTIIAFLASRESQGCPFTVIQKKTGLTSGNLSSHLSMLESHQMISITKTFNKKKPQTLVSLTPHGKQILEAFIASMEEIIKEYRATVE